MDAMDRRCDGCGALPAYRYALRGWEFRLCGHHGRRHGTVLRRGGWMAYRLIEMGRVSA